MSNHFFLALSACVYIFYIFGLLLFAFKQRKAAVRSKLVDHKFFKTQSGHGGAPDELLILGRHMDNQFQVPLIFMVTVAVILGFKDVSLLPVGFAWFFVLTRFIHSYVHLGSNNVLSRAKTYMVGWLMLFAMWIYIMIHFADV